MDRWKKGRKEKIVNHMIYEGHNGHYPCFLPIVVSTEIPAQKVIMELKIYRLLPWSRKSICTLLGRGNC